MRKTSTAPAAPRLLIPWLLREALSPASLAQVDAMGCVDIVLPPGQSLQRLPAPLAEAAARGAHLWVDVRGADDLAAALDAVPVSVPVLVDRPARTSREAASLLHGRTVILCEVDGQPPDDDGALQQHQVGRGSAVAPWGRTWADWLDRARRLARETTTPLALFPPTGPEEPYHDEALLALGFCLGHHSVAYVSFPHAEWTSLLRLLLESLELRRVGINFISCPTCGRCAHDIVSVVERVKAETGHLLVPITVAIMGCEVNGPGEASHADLGMAATKDGGVLFRKGDVVRRVRRSEMATALIEEIHSLAAEGPGREDER